MFSRDWTLLPKEPEDGSATLAKYDLHVNSKGQIVDSKGNHFHFFHSSSERANEVRKEGVHEGVRQVVAAELAKFGVNELYLGGEDGIQMFEEKPEGKHATILCTTPKVLAEKKEVIVIIGEHSQDAGIWAYRHLMRDGGIDGGSAVGLCKKLHNMKFFNAFKQSMTSFGKEVMREMDHLTLHASGADAQDPVLITDTAGMPGIIILNPGQLYFSHELNKSMTKTSWLARPKENVFEDDVQIDGQANLIPGHTTPQQHVETVFEGVIPLLLGTNRNNQARIWVIGIADGADNFIEYLDYQLAMDPKCALANRVEAIAMAQPLHDVHVFESRTITPYLDRHAKSWILSNTKLDYFLNAPNGYKLILSPKSHADLLEDEARAVQEVDAKAIRRSMGSPVPDDTEFVVVDEPVVEAEEVEAKAAEAEEAKNDYDHMTQHVSCPTVSGGVADYVEMIFPNAMDSMLKYFKEHMDVVDQHSYRLKQAHSSWTLPPVVEAGDEEEAEAGE